MIIRTNLSRTKDETLDLMYKLAYKMAEDGFKWAFYNKVWDLAYAWNDEHPEETELFVGEDYNEQGNLVLYIEDDWFEIEE